MLSFFKINILKKITRMSNSLHPDQAQHFIKPDVGPNCLEKLSAENTRRQRVESAEMANNLKADQIAPAGEGLSGYLLVMGLSTGILFQV